MNKRDEIYEELVAKTFKVLNGKQEPDEQSYSPYLLSEVEIEENKQEQELGGKVALKPVSDALL